MGVPPRNTPSWIRGAQLPYSNFFDLALGPGSGTILSTVFVEQIAEGDQTAVGTLTGLFLGLVSKEQTEKIFELTGRISWDPQLDSFLINSTQGFLLFTKAHQQVTLAEEITDKFYPSPDGHRLAVRSQQEVSVYPDPDSGSSHVQHRYPD